MVQMFQAFLIFIFQLFSFSSSLEQQNLSPMKPADLILDEEFLLMTMENIDFWRQVNNSSEVVVVMFNESIVDKEIAEASKKSFHTPWTVIAIGICTGFILIIVIITTTCLLCKFVRKMKEYDMEKTIYVPEEQAEQNVYVQM